MSGKNWKTVEELEDSGRTGRQWKNRKNWETAEELEELGDGLARKELGEFRRVLEGGVNANEASFRLP
jgi:hypothetical protein